MICIRKKNSWFTLSSNTVLIFDDVGKPISNAAAILRRDIEKTFEVSRTKGNTIRIAPPESERPAESWTIEAFTDELLIRSADSLGCVYALLFISEHFLGVSSFWFWNNQHFTKRGSVNVSLRTWHSPSYAVRYRGWFVNDEVLIENWQTEPGNREHWIMVFEALLRCGGNMIIPGTDINSHKYRKLAADMGLWITHHHAGPLGSDMFSRIYPDEIPSYSRNKELFESLWEQAVIEQKGYKVIWNLGFRGQGDRPFWKDDPNCITAEERGNVISDVIGRQYGMVKRYVENPVCCINLYGEIPELYRAGYLRLPDGVIKVWADNGYGRMVSRRLGNDNPRVHALPSAGDEGPHGIYFHCSFHDLQSSNHLTMSPNSADFLAAELEKALRAKAENYWIINCGSVKPHVHMLDLIGEIWRTGRADVNEWRERYVRTYYGKNHAEAIAALFKEYALCTAQYGPNEDDRAGEQIWHHPVRELLCCLMSGNTEACLDSLVWLTGHVPFYEQTRKLKEISLETFSKWDVFYGKCKSIRPLLDADSGRLFDDSILLQTYLQWSGASGAVAFCESLGEYRLGDLVNAFRLASKARICYMDSIHALSEAAHDEWTGYYDGDCLTDIRLTLFCVDALISWLRVLGDGPDFHNWERNFLTAAGERKVMLLSSKERSLDNGRLAERLEKILV
jgi:hypothetical protein